MKLLVQRVLEASVDVNDKTVGSIKKGLLVFLGVEKGDTISQTDFLVNKLINLRIFTDAEGKMNLSVIDIKGEILVISQFTLAADTTHGNRPGFTLAELPEKAEVMYNYFNEKLKERGFPPQNGIFQTDMKVKLINDGPATFWLSK
jgi:D-tyrosyl-tRNA(Tyr) deacylase